MEFPFIANWPPLQSVTQTPEQSLQRFLENDHVWDKFVHPTPASVRPPSETGVAQRLRSHFIALADKSLKSILAGERPEGEPIHLSRAGFSPAENNEKAAADALRMVRLALYSRDYGSYKSDNKKRSYDRFVENIRTASGTIAEMNKFGGITNQRHISALRSANIWRSTRINCSGLAKAVQDYVGHHYPHIPVSYLELGSEHALSILGTIETVKGNLPLANWPEHLYVCDPWANIVCPAPDYPRKFVEKMAKWEADLKVVRNANDEWINPTNRQWLACVNAVPKMSIRINYQNGQFTDIAPHRLPKIALPANGPRVTESGS